jgi:hypothetical protein
MSKAVRSCPSIAQDHFLNIQNFHHAQKMEQKISRRITKNFIIASVLA